jgi:translation initiation factor 3 subunit E
VQANCPWLLRYLTIAVITSGAQRGHLRDHGSRNIIRELVQVLQHERLRYSDPITQFMEALYVDFDFEGAQTKLKDCEAVLRSDYLCFHHDGETFVKEFMDAARYFIFETYCRIHSKINITELASKLHLSPAEAETWMVSMIKNAGLEAKMDVEKSVFTMSKSFPSIYQQVIDKTKELSSRSGFSVKMLDGEHPYSATFPSPFTAASSVTADGDADGGM